MRRCLCIGARGSPAPERSRGNGTQNSPYGGSRSRVCIPPSPLHPRLSGFDLKGGPAKELRFKVRLTLLAPTVYTEPGLNETEIVSFLWPPAEEAEKVRVNLSPLRFSKCTFVPSGETSSRETLKSGIRPWWRGWARREFLRDVLRHRTGVLEGLFKLSRAFRFGPRNATDEVSGASILESPGITSLWKLSGLSLSKGRAVGYPGFRFGREEPVGVDSGVRMALVEPGDGRGHAV